MATRDGDNWTLNGSKRWIGNATFSDITTIWAKDAADDQVKGFIVPNSTPGFTATKIEGKTSLRAVQNADITLENVVVPESLRLQNANSFADTAKVVLQTSAEVAWAAVGTAVGAHEAAVKFAHERIQFGKPIGAHQLVQDLLVKSLGNITASMGMVVRISQMLDDGTQRYAHSRWPKHSPRHACGKRSPGAGIYSAATESCSSATSRASSQTPRPSTPTRAPRR